MAAAQDEERRKKTPTPQPSAPEFEIHPESTTHASPEELPENRPHGPLVKALPKLMQDAASGFAQAHAPSEELMTSIFDLARSRMGSGTAWMPASSPMYGLMTKVGGFGLMVRGNIFLGYNWFNSDRGSKRVTSVNSLMVMVWHALWGGEIMPRAILSWEALTIPNGYPLIAQTGATLDGRPVHDRQSPHDVFSELAVMYSRPVHNDVAFQLYLALAGEPALGPGSYTYRVSALSDPLAPLSYSLQDGPRIASGVITAGVFGRKYKGEISWFNGREPDDRRWDLDLNKPDSFSTRLTFNPTFAWSAQVSYAYFSEPYRLTPERGMHRVTASAMYNQREGLEDNWATTLTIGQNLEEPGPSTTSVLLESNWNLDGHNTLFGRAEFVERTARWLAIPAPNQDQRYQTGAITLGYVYYFRPLLSLAPGIGVRASLTALDVDLEPHYGTRVPVGLMAYAQLRPSALAVRLDPPKRRMWRREREERKREREEASRKGAKKQPSNSSLP